LYLNPCPGVLDIPEIPAAERMAPKSLRTPGSRDSGPGRFLRRADFSALCRGCPESQTARQPRPQVFALTCLLLLAILAGGATARAQAPAGADIDKQLATLTAERDRLADELAKRIEADARNDGWTDLLLRFDEGADGDELRMTLRRRGGGWTQAEAVVPYWRHETFQEQWAASFYRTATGVPFDRRTYPVETGDLTVDAARVRGSLLAQLARDRLKEERFAPGESWTGLDKISWYDRFGYVGHTVPRPQTYRLDAQVRSDARAYALQLHGAMDGHAIQVEFDHPGDDWPEMWVAAPTFNGGHHSGAVRDWTVDGQRLTGTLDLTMVADAWHPRGKPRQVQTFRIEADLRGGRVHGRYTSTGEMDAGQGAVTGLAGLLVDGRYQADGSLGPCQGRVRGMLISAPPPLGPQLAGNASPPEAPADALRAAATHAAEIYSQIRALRLALAKYPMPLADALQAVEGAQPAGAADAAAWVEFVARTVAAVATAGPTAPLPAPVAADVSQLPSGDARALPASASGGWQAPPAGDATGWYHIPAWRALGPLPQVSGIDTADSGLPDLVAMPALSYDVKSTRLLARGVVLPGREPPAWIELADSGGRIEPPWHANRIISTRFAGGVWYAQAEIVSDASRPVRVAINVGDRGALWLNDRLIWADAEKPWSERSRVPALLTLPLQQGVNRLLLRVRYDRRETWARVLFAAGPVAPAAPPTAQPDASPKLAGWRGDGTGHFPQATPPLAWDIEQGNNVAWRVKLAGMRGQPVAIDGKLFVHVEPHGLATLDAATGQLLWRADGDAAAAGGEPAGTEPGHATPVADGRFVWIHHGNGFAACYTADGARKWQTQTGLVDATLRLAGGNLIVAGATVTRRARGEAAAHLIVALDAATGRQRWRAEVPGQYERETTQSMRLPMGGGALEVVVTSSFRVLAAEDGRVLISELPFEPWGRFTVCVENDVLYVAGLGRKHAIRLRALDKDRVVAAWLWESNYEISGSGPVAVESVALDATLYTWGQIQERGPHCMVSLNEVCALDAHSGRMLGRLKPVAPVGSSSGHGFAPAVAGGYLYVLDAGGATHSSLRDAGLVAVLRPGPQPYVLTRNRVPLGVQAAPVFDGDRMFLRTGGELICIAANTDAGRRFQQTRIAEQVLADIGPRPDVLATRAIAPLGEPPPAEAPVSLLTPDYTIGKWLIAAPFPPPANEAIDPATLRPTRGANLELAGVTRAFEPLDARPVTVGWSQGGPGGSGFYLQGRGLKGPRMVGRIESVRCTGPDGTGTAWLYTLLDNTRSRTARFAVDGRGVSAWLNGESLPAGDPVRLAPGLYPFLVRVEPEFFKRPWQPPTDVAKAMQAGVVKDIGWPTEWIVFGPMPEGLGQLDDSQLASVPDALTIGETRYAPVKMRARDAAVELTGLLALLGGESRDRDEIARDIQGQMAYAFAEIEAPADGRLIINATADWYMAWWLNGEPIHSTLEQGNQKAHTDITAHSIGVDVAKGRHVLAVMVTPGTRGWSFASRGGFTDHDREALRPYYIPRRVPGPTKQDPPRELPPDETPPPVYLAPRFRETDDAAAMLRVWHARATTRREMLERIAAVLADAPLGNTARQILDTIDKPGPKG
jgi:outer membrane protein assembly factor BamB